MFVNDMCMCRTIYLLGMLNCKLFSEQEALEMSLATDEVELHNVVLNCSSHVFMCTSTDSNNCLCTWLTVYIEIVITADCKLLPWQQMKMCKYLLSSCVDKVTEHIFLALCISIGLIPNDHVM